LGRVVETPPGLFFQGPIRAAPNPAALELLRFVATGGTVPRRWFVSWGWIYRPVSLQGFGLVALAAVFCVQVFIAVDRHSHSASDTLYGIFPFVVPCLMLLNWVAGKTCGSVE
jgi:hypothetical protein